jgi:Flp pilus assembly protein TadB
METEELRDAVELYSRVGGSRALELIRAVVTNLREGMNARFQVDQYVRGAKTTAVMVALVPVGYVAVMAFIAPDLFSVLVNTFTGRTVIFGCLVIFGFGLWLLWNILRGIEEF